jgi:hypothetical protein
MHSIGAQIHDDLVELGCISQHVRLCSPQSHLELHSFGQRDRDPLEGLLDNALDADRAARIKSPRPMANSC